MKDELRGKSPNGKFWIINLENSDQGGSHWCCMIDYLPLALWIDPFGISPPPQYVRPFIKRSKRLYKGKYGLYSTAQYQSLDSDQCFWFCAEFIDESLSKKNILDSFNDDLTEYPSEHNEELVARVKL
jgi:hypothetical protein